MDIDSYDSRINPEDLPKLLNENAPLPPVLGPIYHGYGYGEQSDNEPKALAKDEELTSWLNDHVDAPIRPQVKAALAVGTGLLAVATVFTYKKLASPKAGS